MTFLDVLVAWYCGPLVWKTWGLFPWCRIGLLALASGMAFTLMDVWSQARMKRMFSRLDATGIRPALGHATPSVDMESADV